MANIPTNNNLIHGPAEVAPQPVAAASSMLQSIGQRIFGWGEAFSGPLRAMGFNPITDPEGQLKRIDDLANNGLQRANLGKVKYDKIVGTLHQKFDSLEIPASKTPQKNLAPGVGEVAILPNQPVDPEVTRAIPLQALEATMNWKDKAVEHRKNLAKKLSAFSAIYQMREACGIKEKDNSLLLKMVDKATKEETKENLWDLFTNHYNLTLSQKLRAGWVYWSRFQTSLISNTVGAYLESFVKNMTEDLTSSDHRPRLKLIRKLLEQIDEFLNEDMGATKAFALAVQPDSLDKFRRRAIENNYNNSLEDLCKAFSAKIIDENYRVPFFRRSQKIPILGYVFQFFEWLVNRLIIQRAMKSAILPAALKSAVENGLEATEPHNVPFALAIARFLNKQLDKLKHSSPTTPPAPLPGTEILPGIIKKLQMVIELEPLKTQSELKQKFKEFDEGKGFLDKKIEEGIQEGISEASRFLFDYLNNAAQSGELFANLLELSCAPFSDQTTDPAALVTEYKKERDKLKKDAGDLFKKTIRESVEKKLTRPKLEAEKKATEQAFLNGQKIATETFGSLRQLCERMAPKIDRSAQAPTPENNVQADIAIFLQNMQVFANRKELQDRIKGLQKGDRDAIWRLMTPFYEKAVQLEEKVLHLQELQDQYPAHIAVGNKLKFTKELLESIRNQFHLQPRHQRNPLVETLKKTRDEIGKFLGPQALPTLQQNSDLIAKYSESIATEQQVLDALHAFYPPRVEGQHVEQEGLLEQLLRYEQGIHSPGFQPRACLNEVGRLLEFFPPAEQEELRILIGDGSDLGGKWARLGALLQRIYERHREIKDRDAAILDEALRTTLEWTEAKIQQYTLLKDQDHVEMQSEMRNISADVVRLHNEAHSWTTQLHLPFTLTSGQAKFAYTSLGAAVGSLGGGLGWLTGGAGGAAMGAFVASTIVSGVRNWRGILDKEPGAAATTLGSIAFGTGLSYFLPAVGTGALGLAGAYTGHHAVETLQTDIQDKVVPAVMDLFNNAYDLLVLSPRIPLAAMTRPMQLVARGGLNNGAAAG
ncbi:MAG TPA: hypothetical protein VLF94_03945 [Chlamydiales bacterium]|nr:hypothetical protein [Chlamydiales bacterium]